MFQETAYTSRLDKRAGQIFDKVTHHQKITNEETLVLVLKAHNDPIHQLAQVMTEGFTKMDQRFEQMDKRLEQVKANFKWGPIATMAFLSLLMTGLKLFS